MGAKVIFIGALDAGNFHIQSSSKFFPQMAEIVPAESLATITITMISVQGSCSSSRTASSHYASMAHGSKLVKLKVVKVVSSTRGH